MRVRKIAIGIVLVVVVLPVLLFALATGVFYGYFYESERASAAMISGGREREYLLYVPKSLDRKKPSALVVSLHGAASWPGTQRRLSGWNAVADEHGFIVVYPSGTSVTGSGDGTGASPKAWLLSKAGLEADVRFINDLLNRLRAEYAIDPARIYVEGLSNGGGMAFALSCRMSGRIAAIGAVAAAQVLPWTWCNDTRPVAMVAFHGTADTFAPYRGGESWTAPRPFPNVEEWAANWARRNGCEPKPVVTAVGTDVKRIEYPDCAERASVVLYRIEGGGHNWPGAAETMPEWFAGRTTRAVDATRELWRFFEQHRRQ